MLQALLAEQRDSETESGRDSSFAFENLLAGPTFSNLLSSKFEGGGVQYIGLYRDSGGAVKTRG